MNLNCIPKPFSPPPAGWLPMLLALQLAPALAIAQAEGPLQVRVEPLRLEPIVEELPLSGSIVSPSYSDLAMQVSGLVTAVLVDVGDRVKAGQVLVRLDPELTRLQREGLAARHEEALLAFDNAKRLADEGRRLIGDRHISQTQYDSLLVAEAIEATRLRQLDSELAMADLNLSRHELRAPFAGVIGARHIDVGEWLAAGAPALQLVLTDPLRVQVSVPERYYGDVRAGTLVTVTVEALPGETFAGEVESLAASALTDTRSFTARLDLPNPEHRLAPGMSSQVRLAMAGADAKPVFQAPADAIIRRGDGSALVWRVRDGRAEAVDVVVGRRHGNRVEVNGTGLAADDQLITLGNESLQAGQPVTVLAR